MSKIWNFENHNLENGNLFEAAQSLLLRPPLPPVDSSILSALCESRRVFATRALPPRTEPGLVVVYYPVGSVGRTIN